MAPEVQKTVRIKYKNNSTTDVEIHSKKLRNKECEQEGHGQESMLCQACLDFMPHYTQYDYVTAFTDLDSAWAIFENGPSDLWSDDEKKVQAGKRSTHEKEMVDARNGISNIPPWMRRKE